MGGLCARAVRMLDVVWGKGVDGGEGRGDLQALPQASLDLRPDSAGSAYRLLAARFLEWRCLHDAPPPTPLL